MLWLPHPVLTCYGKNMLISLLIPIRGYSYVAGKNMLFCCRHAGLRMLLFYSLSLCIRSDLPLDTSFYAFTYALTPLPYCNYVLCTMWFCLHVLHLLYVVPLVSGKDHVPLGYI